MKITKGVAKLFKLLIHLFGRKDVNVAYRDCLIKRFCRFYIPYFVVIIITIALFISATASALGFHKVLTIRM